MDLSLYTFYDIIEIIICIGGYTALNSWLYQQQEKKLLFYWYSYHVLIIASYFFELSTLFFITACCFPVVIMLMIIMHEQRLQKMFVVTKRIDPLAVTSANSSWQDELIKFALIRLNEQKDLRVVIECKDTLSTLINASERIDAQLKKNTLELLYYSFNLPKDAFLWITTTGNIVSLSAYWKNFSNVETAHATASIDCIALHACAATRRFTLIYDAKTVENLSAHHALNLLYELSHLKTQENNHVTTPHVKSYSDATLS